MPRVRKVTVELPGGWRAALRVRLDADGATTVVGVAIAPADMTQVPERGITQAVLRSVPTNARTVARSYADLKDTGATYGDLTRAGLTYGELRTRVKITHGSHTRGGRRRDPLFLAQIAALYSEIVTRDGSDGVHAKIANELRQRVSNTRQAAATPLMVFGPSWRERGVMACSPPPPGTAECPADAGRSCPARPARKLRLIRSSAPSDAPWSGVGRGRDLVVGKRLGLGWGQVLIDPAHAVDVSIGD